MINIKAQIETSLLTTQAANQVLKVVNSLVMQEQRALLPGHFDPSAVTKYGYRKRSKAYQIRKARKYRHQKPLVWSGELQRAVLSSAKVTSTSKQGTLTARGSRKSNLSPSHRRELEAFTADEERQRGQSFVDYFTKLATDPSLKRKRTRNV